MKVIILGSRGMLGVDLAAALERVGATVLGYDLPTLDITDYDNVWRNVPLCDWVINCAAYTHVDGAEENRDHALNVNGEGARNVARVCLKKKVKLLQISTDYVFDGMRTRAYKESDQPNPLNVYGTSKLTGEKAIRAEGGHYLILRTQSLFGKGGHNFVRVIVNKLEENQGEPLQVVNDQTTAPTYSVHLAEAIADLLPLNKHGVVHVSASGECTWYEFAKAIAQRVKPGAPIEAVDSKSMDRPAARPAYSVLDNRLYRMWSGHTMPTWEEGLAEFLKKELN